MSTEAEFYPYSQQPALVPMVPYSTLTKVSGLELGNAATSSLQTKQNLKTSNSTGLTQSVPEEEIAPVNLHKRRRVTTETMNRATSGMRENATSERPSVGTNTYAKSVGRTTGRENANRSREALEPRAKRPRYTRGLLWDSHDDTLSATAQWSLSAEPVPDVPAKEYENKAVVETIASHPHLFNITTPIKVDRFESLLTKHPNPNLVNSVCRSLRTGFWPHANTHHETYPVTWDNSYRPIRTKAEQDFIEAQIDKEVLAGRYSEDFGPDLLPGMYCSPIHTVPKPGTDTLRLINDQSAGEFAPNSMISRDDIAGTCMDGIKSLGASLRAFRRDNGDDIELVIHKSDVAGAYRNIPMSPMWQIKQAVACGDRRHIDGCNCFGCRGSYYVYLAFISLVCWIAEHAKMIKNLKCYIDDNCSFARLGDVKYYTPYKRYFPTDQTKLLELWDEIGLPHEERKQIYGPVIPFIGFDVDPNKMTITINDERKQNLLTKVRHFAKTGKRHTLKEFQSIAGHINWSLAVFPLLKPGLSAVYEKTADKSRLMASIRVNNAVRDELLWFANHAQNSDGIFLLKTVAWDPTVDLQDTITCFTDASLRGMAFWFPEFNLGYQCHIPEDAELNHIFYYEALAVTSAILQDTGHTAPRMVVHTDNQNTINIWHSLKAHAPYNKLLMIAIDKLIDQKVDARVLHIPGVANTVSDALSRFQNEIALRLVPGLKIAEFQPPHGTLGAAKK